MIELSIHHSSFQFQFKKSQNIMRIVSDSNNVVKRVVVVFLLNFSFSQFNPILIVFFRDVVRDFRVNGCESFILSWCHIVIRQFMLMELLEDIFVILIAIMGRQFIILDRNKLSIRKLESLRFKWLKAFDLFTRPHFQMKATLREIKLFHIYNCKIRWIMRCSRQRRMLLRAYSWKLFFPDIKIFLLNFISRINKKRIKNQMQILNHIEL